MHCYICMLDAFHFQFHALKCRFPSPRSLPFEFAGAQASQPHRFYVDQLVTMKERELQTLYINFEHLFIYDQVRSLHIAPFAQPPPSHRPLPFLPGPRR